MLNIHSYLHYTYMHTHIHKLSGSILSPSLDASLLHSAGSCWERSEQDLRAEQYIYIHMCIYTCIFAVASCRRLLRATWTGRKGRARVLCVCMYMWYLHVLMYMCTCVHVYMCILHQGYTDARTDRRCVIYDMGLLCCICMGEALVQDRTQHVPTHVCML